MDQLPRVAVHSAEELYTQYVLKNRPVIITNFQKSWADPSVFTKKQLSEKVRVCVRDRLIEGYADRSFYGRVDRQSSLIAFVPQR